MKIMTAFCVDCNRSCEVELEDGESAPTDLQCPDCQDGGRFESLKPGPPIVKREPQGDEDDDVPPPPKKKPKPRINIKEID